MLAIQADYNLQHPGAWRQHRAAAPILIVKRSRSQLFLSIRFCGATAQTETIRWTPINICMESGGLHAYIEGIITIHLRWSCDHAEPSADIPRARALEKGIR